MPIFTTQSDATGSNNADIILVYENGGGGQANTVYAGGGMDLVIGDHDSFFIDTNVGNNSFATAQNVDLADGWSTHANQDITNPAVPHTTIVGSGTGNFDFYSVSIGANQSITLDIDYGNSALGGTPFDSVVELYDANGQLVASNDDGNDGGLGSSSSLDSCFTYTAANAGTYFIRVRAVGLNPVPAGATYLLNLSVQNHAATATGAVDVDTLYGDGGNDLLQGGGGNDILFGGDDSDVAYGNDGNDTFFDDDDAALDKFYGGAGDDMLFVVANGGTTDFVDTEGNNSLSAELSASGWYINLFTGIATSNNANVTTQQVKIGKVYGSNYDDTITAHSSGTVIFGLKGNDTINGFSGDDVIDGGLGNDIMNGGGGSDTLSYATASSQVTVNLGITSQQDTGGAGLDTINDFANLIGSGYGDTLTGSALDNKIEGGEGNDLIQGGLGDDILDGGDGAQDIVSYQSAGSKVVVDLLLGGAQDTQGAGKDTLSNFESLVGSNFDDVLTGNTLDNVIDGGKGADIMTGGLGNDTYYVDNAGDKVIELSGQGGDTVYAEVSYSLAGQYIEVLNLTGAAAINGSGNGLDNRIVGNNAINTLNGGDGNDKLDGRLGADKLIGGIGNDTYVVEDAGDKITELDGQGNDTVEASISYSLAGQYIETLKLTGIGDINGTGNGLANTMIGNNYNNKLNGGTGADQMSGGGGNDTYVVDNINDKVIELVDQGYDTVESSVTFSLAGQYAEQLILTGSSAINGTGNGLGNNLTGNGAANTLSGGGGVDWLNGMLGSDTLIGGAGSDRFVFSTTFGAGNVDKITDFSVAEDYIVLDDALFGGIGTNSGNIGDAFHSGAAAHDADDRIVYNPATGSLYYDPDGTGAANAILFAQLTTKPALTVDNILAIEN